MQAIVDKIALEPDTLPGMPFLILLFILVPIAEIFVIIQVGQAIGPLPTVGLLILDSIVGAWLLRSQGRRAWAAFRDALAARPRPAPRDPATARL